MIDENVQWQQALFSSKLLKVLSDPIRIMIFKALRQGPKNSTQLCALIKIKPSKLAFHLSQFAKAGGILPKRQGREIHYHLQNTFLERLEKFIQDSTE